MWYQYPHGLALTMVRCTHRVVLSVNRINLVEIQSPAREATPIYLLETLTLA